MGHTIERQEEGEANHVERMRAADRLLSHYLVLLVPSANQRVVYTT